MRTRFRSVWISDTHLGTRGAQAQELAWFLQHIQCDHLYLVGDIIDMWRLKRRWLWPESHNTVVRRILKHATRGTQVVLIPGNHDDALRPYAGLDVGGIRIALNAAHRTADGRNLLVSHGDQYDLVVKHHRTLSMLGGWAYEALLRANSTWNAARSVCGLPYHSLSGAIKAKVKGACQFISRFEEELVSEAVRGGFDGVVCGHIHKAESRSLGIAYYNCGDWVESCTALVEDDSGTVRVIDGLAFNAAHRREEPALGEQRVALDSHSPGDEEEWIAPTLPFPLPTVPARARTLTR